ncbi:MAG: TlpA family protein disulfide reductase [Deltaproteobacteria bacterium]|nr:MAG: TlpA family protein disulfide reductase [Deltaproteobacteria bacterium]
MANSRGLKVAVAAVAVGLAAAGGLLALGHRGPRLAPDFAAPDLAGHAVRLSALRGQVVVLNLWTTWCPPCREEMPSMERLYGQLRDRDFQLLAVSQDEDGSKTVEPFVRQLGITFPVLLDPERQVGERYGVWGYPETFIIDRNGYVVERVIGPRDWATPAQLAALEALIAADGDGANASAPRGPS